MLWPAANLIAFAAIPQVRRRERRREKSFFFFFFRGVVSGFCCFFFFLIFLFSHLQNTFLLSPQPQPILPHRTSASSTPTPSASRGAPTCL